MITANPEITKVKNEGIDFMIMGCDGIWEVKKSGEMIGWIQSRISKQKKLDQILKQLLSELVAKDNKQTEWGMDNMSAILIKFLKTKK